MNDKWKHLTVSFAICEVLQRVVSFETAATLTLALGAAKEIWDLMGHGCAEWGDILADVVGVFLSWTVRF